MAPGRWNPLHQRLCQCINHFRAGENPGKDASGKHQQYDGHGVARMGKNAFLLNIQLRIVDHQRQYEPDQEQDRGMHDPHHQCDHHRDHQQQVDVGQFRSFVWRVFKYRLDVAISPAAFQLDIADPLALGTP
ncbi:hypothetical protein D3C76_1552460 [compost metagenome]